MQKKEMISFMCLQPLRQTVHLRAALHNDTTHSIHAMVTHVHTLILDLDHPALEVLLVEQQDLRTRDGCMRQKVSAFYSFTI